MIGSVIRRSLVAASLLLVAAAPAAAAAAPPAPVFGMRGVPNPKLGYFVYTLAAGGSTQGAVLVSNNGNASGTVRLYTADGATGSTTGAVYLTNKKPVLAGAWVSLDHSSLTLAPGTHQLVDFSVHVPATVRPGQWVGGIVAETQQLEQGQRTKSKSSVQVRVRSQTIVAVQVDIPGPTAARFRIGAVSTGGTHGFQQVLIGVTNVGNALTKPTGSVIVKSSTGAPIETIPFRMDTFLPKTSIVYPVVLKKALAPGSYQASVTLDYTGAAGAAKTVVANPSFTVNKQNVQQVFTSATPTQTPPPTAASSSSSGSTGSSGTSPALIVGIAAGAVLLLGLVSLALRRRRSAG